MHESSLVAGIIRIVSQEAQQARARGHAFERVQDVCVSVGFFTCIDTHFLQECFALMVEESTHVRGAVLRVRRRALTCYCDACDLSFELNKSPFCCPHCGQTHVHFDDAYGCTVDSIDLC